MIAAVNNLVENEVAALTAAMNGLGDKRRDMTELVILLLLRPLPLADRRQVFADVTRILRRAN
jgi:hypothetical protein